MAKVLAGICLGVLVFFAEGICQEDVLETYIRTGLKNNLALQQKDFSLRKSLAALREARGQFLPSLTLLARYSRAGGGRVIDIPVGDLVNPIFQSLNELLQQQRFPLNVPNERINFLREEEHETKLRVVQPVFQPALLYNYKIKAHLKEADQAARDLFARQLVADIKTAYFNYLKAVRVLQLYEATQKLLQENLRVSERLVASQKATRDVVYRAQAELSELLQQKAAARRDQDLAAAYLNVLLNRPLSEAIVVPDTLSATEVPTLDLPSQTRRALRNRDEIRSVRSAIAAAENGARLVKAAYLPGISFVFDYGYQGEKYRFTAKDDFWMASFVLQWNLFNGFQDRSRSERADLEKNKIAVQLQEIKQRIRFQVRQAVANVRVAQQTIRAATDRLHSARKSFEIIDRKFRVGMASQIEFIDARTTLTRAEINAILARFDLQIRVAELEKVTATFPLAVLQKN